MSTAFFLDGLYLVVRDRDDPTDCRDALRWYYLVEDVLENGRPAECS